MSKSLVYSDIAAAFEYISDRNTFTRMLYINGNKNGKAIYHVRTAHMYTTYILYAYNITMVFNVC